jgi:hypothetical protein
MRVDDVQEEGVAPGATSRESLFELARTGKVMASTVHVVHCIDTEGPLYESLEATFERLKANFGLDLEPNPEMLRRLQAGEVDLGGAEAAVQAVVDSHLLAYNDTWDKLDLMLKDCMSAPFRMRVTDSEGGGWIYNWFCVDHVDYDTNPRRRDIGYHNVFDHYSEAMRQSDSPTDGLHFHYHPHNFRREAHRCATHWWASSDSLQEILSRRVIDRHWFPSAHRPGFHVIRPDSHWFLEQFIPFDYSSQAVNLRSDDGGQSGGNTGRWGDWRRAPVTWEPYHPAPDDYQTPGSCRRWIARCLNVGTRFRLLTECDVRQAFEEARSGRPVILSFTDHDHRDMRPDVETVRALLVSVSADYPDVPFRFAEAVEAMRNALVLPYEPPCDLAIAVRASNDRAHVLEVTTRAPTFGPQPWLALKTVAGTYHHDNFDIDTPHRQWRYVFDEDTFPLGALSAVGVAATNAYGTTTVSVLDPVTGTVERKTWNM